MAKVIYVCLKDGRLRSSTCRALRAVASRLAPDNLVVSPPMIGDHDGILIGVVNPTPDIMIGQGSVCLGRLTEGHETWLVPMAGIPDGSFALFRGNRQCVEIMTDVVASRTIWYVMNESMFAASTSQRALAILLGSFRLNEQVIPWMLASGTLGPDQAWDSRVVPLRGDSTARLDRASWVLHVERRPCVFSTLPVAIREHRASLEKAVRHTCQSLDVDYSHWALPLSGGFDSRGILCSLRRTDGLRTVTWGLESAKEQSGGDATLARALARQFHLRNDYFTTDLSDEPVDRIMDRFVASGEGRVDNLAGYMDGFRMWKGMYESGIRGIIRGEHGFGWRAVSSAPDARRTIGMRLWSDYANVRPLSDFGFPDHQVPAHLLARSGESLETWRDRLYHQFRVPAVLAALNDLKLPFVEIASPLLSRRIISVVRQLPDDMRTNKRLFKAFVRDIGPALGFARWAAIDGQGDILRSAPIVGFLRDQLSSSRAVSCVPKAFLDYVAGRIEGGSRRKTHGVSPWAMHMLRGYAPAWVKARVRAAITPMMDFNLLAFRTFLIGRTTALLAEDAGVHVPVHVSSEAALQHLR